MAQTTHTLTTFIEPDPDDAALPNRYLAGFRDLDGEPWDLIVPLAAEVRRVVGSAKRRWNVAMFQIEGLVHPQPEDLDAIDDTYSVMLEAGMLEHVAIDWLGEYAIDMECNEPDEKTLPDLKKLRERLEHCIIMVDKEIARREGRKGAS